MMRKFALATLLALSVSPAFGQVPAPVPALPDTERRTSYSISGTTCACSVGWALYGDSTDYQNWVEVWINGVRYDFNDAGHGWTITSPSGSLSTLARPITNAVLTFNAVQTGTVQIVGARRPRRTAQFAENQGVSARNLNQVFTDIISQNREIWDKTNDMTGRGFFAPPGQTGGVISGSLNGVISGPSSVSADGNLAVWNGTSGAALKDGGIAPVSVTSPPYSAKGDGLRLSDGAISSGTNGFTSASATFTANDVGKLIRIVGAGAAAATLETTIASFVGVHSVTTTANAGSTVSGAVAFYGTDDTAAIQSALGSVMSGSVKACLYVPTGLFMTSSALSVTGPVCVYGNGASIFGYLGSLIQPPLASNAINITGQFAGKWDGLGIFYASAATSAGDAAINVDSGGGSAYNYFSRFKNLTFLNVYNMMRFRQGIYAVIDGINAQDIGNVGFIVADDNPVSFGDFGNLKITNSNLLSFATTPASCIFWTSGGGLSFENSTCLGGAIGVSLNPRTGTDMTQVSITGNHFDGVGVGVQYVRQGATGTLQELIVSNNTGNNVTRFLSVPNDAAGIGLNSVYVGGNTIRGANSASAKLIFVDSANNVNIGPNTLTSNNAATVGITIGAAATNVILGPNSFTGTFANDWTNASASFKAANGVQPNTGGILYSGVDRISLLNGTATAGQMLRSGNVAAPTWSTATWPATTTINQLLYSSAANTVAGLATANSSILSTSSGGVPSFSNAQAQANLGLRQIAAAAVNVNFNSANTDTAIPFTMPTGFTRMIPFRLLISGASASLTTSTFGVFTNTGGGGTAIVSAGQANTVSTAADATANNMQSVSPAITTSFVATSLATPNTINFRVGTAQGSAATANVTFYYFAEP